MGCHDSDKANPRGVHVCGETLPYTPAVRGTQAWARGRCPRGQGASQRQGVSVQSGTSAGCGLAGACTQRHTKWGCPNRPACAMVGEHRSSGSWCLECDGLVHRLWENSNVCGRRKDTMRCGLHCEQTLAPMHVR
jgi:hypothetical protein